MNEIRITRSNLEVSLALVVVVIAGSMVLVWDRLNTLNDRVWDVHDQVASLRVDLHTDIRELRADIRTDIGELRADVRELAALIRAQEAPNTDRH